MIKPLGSGNLMKPRIDRGDARFVGKRYGARARRVASSYARMFLEDFHLGGGADKIGRFYWTGLGAFAAKQVAVNIDSWQVNAPTMDVVHEGLGKGNLWIYNDLLPWCYGYAADPDAFPVCAKQRDSKLFDPSVKRNLMRQQWADEAIPKCPVIVEPSKDIDDAGTGKQIATLGYFKWTPRVSIGFDYVKKWELVPDNSSKAPIAFNHLWVMAQHEQGEVLQALIYDDQAFKDKLKIQRNAERITDPKPWNPLSLLHALIPPLQLSFTADDSTNDMHRRSNAPKDLILENYVQRMAWIKTTGLLFHSLMLTKRGYMRGELRSIASWGGLT